MSHTKARRHEGTKKYRKGFEPETSVIALGWVGKRVEAREDGGWVDERGHFGTVARADDRPLTGEYGWFYFLPDGKESGSEIWMHSVWMHSTEVYPPEETHQPKVES